LAEWYSCGDRLAKDYAAAVRWYQRGADLGDPLATLQLFLAYSEGELGLQRDLTLANRYKELAEQQDK